MIDCEKCTIKDGCALAGDNYKKELCEKYTEEKFKYHYYVTYYYLDNKRNTGIGSTSAFRTKKLSTMDEIVKLQKFIAEENNFKKIIILNYKELEVS